MYNIHVGGALLYIDRIYIYHLCCLDLIDCGIYIWSKFFFCSLMFCRSYFRCTHKYTQGCKATKQVQKLESEPRMFSITYIGNHTCNTNEVTPKIKPCIHHDEIITDSEEIQSPSLMISMKEEEENHHHGSSTESDLQLVWQEMLVFAEEHHHHHEAVYGCGETSTSINGLDSADLWSCQQFSV